MQVGGNRRDLSFLFEEMRGLLLHVTVINFQKLSNLLESLDTFRKSGKWRAFLVAETWVISLCHGEQCEALAWKRSKRRVGY